MSSRTSTSFVPTVVASGFGQALRFWRSRRGMSQLRMSVDSGISQRHISFLESGRARPSREMVLKLGLVLDVPLRQRNMMLLAAGFAPLYRERELSDPELRPVRQALDLMLAQHEPYPAVVVDRLWNLALANRGATRLIDWLLGPAQARAAPIRVSPNLALAMLHPAGLRRHVENWRQVAADMLHWVHREALAEGGGGPAQALLDELLALDGIPSDWRSPDLESRATPFLAIRLVKDAVALNLFTTITTLGTPHDVTLHELRVECFYPTDEPTAHWFARPADAVAP